jgi:ribose transport system ATP-binding protein
MIPPPVLRIAGIRKHFGATAALEEVSLDLRPGEVHALIGENGAGKSTLMNILSGDLAPDEGTMELLGKSFQPTDPFQARRRGIALIHQELSLCPHLSVTENILMGIETSQYGLLDSEAMEQRTREVLDYFRHPDLSPEKRVGDLALPAQQVVEICRALAARASILLMDEPTSSLSRTDVEKLFAIIRRLRQEGVSVIYISHFLEEVRQVADRCTVLRDGQNVLTAELKEVSDETLIAHMVGREVHHLFPARKAPAEGQRLLSVEGLCSPPGLRKAGFELHAGEILGIAGLTGSGRTEMVRALFGLLPATAGKITLRSGRSVEIGQKPANRLAQGFGYLSEDRQGEGLLLKMPITDNITITRSKFCSRMGWLNLPRRKERAACWVERLKIKAVTADDPLSSLSGGNQQKVALARLLHQEADIFLLDEPTRGIDIGSKVWIYEIIAECAAEGKAILMVSSYLPELFGMCHRLAVMSRGILGAARPVGEWTPETLLQAAIEGEASPAPELWAPALPASFA